MVAKKKTILNKEEHDRQVYEYVNCEMANYKDYAEFLHEVLEHACRVYEVEVIVQHRVKSPAGFAEKCIRKSYKYKDPVHQLTDLAGARVITTNLEEVKKVCRFIEETFEVDWHNTLDVRTRLKSTEFGYLSMHYVIQVKKDDRKVLGINVPRSIGARKAEIQVRTLLQHAWAAVSHDRIYKGDFKVTGIWERELAKTAALLENSDNAFSKLINGLDNYKSDYCAYMSRDDIHYEIAKWEAAYRCDDLSAKLVHKIARLAIAIEDWKKAEEILEFYWKKTESLRRSGDKSPEAFILHDIGIVLCQKGHIARKKRGKSVFDKSGRDYLLLAVKSDPTNSDAWCDIGDTWLKDNNLAKALDYYKRAYEVNPDDPRVLAGYIETKLCIDKDTDCLFMIKPNLEAAIKKCYENVAVDLYLPWAYFDIGKFYLFLNKPYESLSAYAKAVYLSKTSIPLEKALESIKRLNDVIADRLPELKWIYRFLMVTRFSNLLNRYRETVLKIKELEEDEKNILEEVAKAEKKVESLNGKLISQKDAVKKKEHLDKERDAIGELDKKKQSLEDVRNKLKATRRRKVALEDQIPDCKERWLYDSGIVSEKLPKFGKPVVIVAGTCNPNLQKQIDEYKSDIEVAFEKFNGTVLSGGTQEGISGIVGDLSQPPQGKINKIAYLSQRRYLPDDAREHPDYKIVRTDGKGFSALDPIQEWADMLAEGIKPWNVRLLGINGGTIAAFEYQLALVVGASVGIIEYSGRAAADLLPDADWWKRGNLIRLPRDPMTLRAFVNPGKVSFPQNEIEELGKAVHLKYCDDNKHKMIVPSMRSWQNLAPDYKHSSMQQALYAVEILETEGYGIRKKAKDKIEFPTFKKREIERMAEKEHGRWIVERLQRGWKYGEKKDDEKKISPYLLPWKKLETRIQNYDRKAVADWPAVFKTAGYEIYKVSGF